MCGRAFQAVRDAVGDRADLLFGTHGQFTTAGAIRLGKALEPFSPLWFEEPIPPDSMPGEIAKVASACSIPIATGERLTTKNMFAAALAGGAAILQPALGRSGGLWEAKKISAIAEVYNAQIAPHCSAAPIDRPIFNTVSGHADGERRGLDRVGG